MLQHLPYDEVSRLLGSSGVVIESVSFSCKTLRVAST